jgi:hypothetical protein
MQKTSSLTHEVYFCSHSFLSHTCFNIALLASNAELTTLPRIYRPYSHTTTLE